MTRATYKLLMAIGVLLNSALYIAGCFIAGLLLGNTLAWRLALATAGVTYLSFVFHVVSETEGDAWQRAAGWLVWLSIALGINAGAALLFR